MVTGVSRDHYAVLGVSPTSDDVVIRAAYRALMRRYHPDVDSSGEAAQRTQAINAAYAVLSHPDSRARYDGSLAAQGLIKPEARHRPSLLRRMVPRPAGMIAVTALAATGALVALSPPIGLLPEDALPLSAELPRARTAIDEPALTPPSSAGIEMPEVPSTNVKRSPGPVPGSRRASSPSAESPVPPVRKSAGKVAASVPATWTPAECLLGDSWADRAVCKSSNLIVLHRQHELVYAQSVARADHAPHSALLGSRERFEKDRDACRSENCLTKAYIAGLRAISDIMARAARQ
jgi:hypothetical protein